MSRRFSLADLLFWLTFVGLALAIVVPLGRAIERAGSAADMVVALAASADGSTFAALLGDGTMHVWDSAGTLKATLAARAGFGGRVALSADGKRAAVWSGWDVNGLGAGSKEGVEVWDVAASRRLKTLSALSMSPHAFSPDGEWLVVQQGIATELHSVTRNVPPKAIGQSTAGSVENGAAFSPDGKHLAVIADDLAVEVYDTVTWAAACQLRSPEWIGEGYVDLAWSPDSQNLAALCFVTDDGQERIDVWQLATKEPQATPLGGGYTELTFLPDGRNLIVAGEAASAVVVAYDKGDVGLARALSPPPTDIAHHVAAGARGETFITADIGGVDLWDVASLQPRRRLFEMDHFPNLWPAAAGMLVWFIVFGVRRARRLLRACGTCGQKFQATGKRDKNVDCPACRQRQQAKLLTPRELGRQQRRTQRKSMAALVFADAGLSAAIASGGQALFGFWPLFFVGLVALPLLLIGLLYLVVKWRLRRAGQPAFDIALAEKAAGAPGTTRQVGEVLVWSAHGTSLAELLEDEIDVARQRLAAALGREAPAPKARALIFADREALQGYAGRLWWQLDARFTSAYLRAPLRRMLVDERGLRERDADPRVTLRQLVIYSLLEDLDGRVSTAWIDQGLVTALSHDDQHHELARLQRRLMAGRAAGRTIAAHELLTTTIHGLWRKYTRAELAAFASRNQFCAQSWSVMEYFCGRGSTPERRLAFQRFFIDDDRRKRPARAIERHFGCSFEELLSRWQTWVEEQVTDEHHPPPDHVARYLTEGPIAKVASSDTPPGERVASIRELGEHGYLLGADCLIALVEQDNEELRSEAVWALECISGKVLGGSATAWRHWRQAVKNVPSRTATPC